MMERDLQQLANQTFDLLVVGAGIYGSFVAWDAALRGLSVALIDKGDFGNATSANSLKIIHGGLRYLQDFNLPLARRMVSERKTWMQIAPHLVHPLPFLMPTTRGLTKNKIALRLALSINDLLGYDRNHSLDPHKWIPPSQVCSKEGFLAQVPGFDPVGVTGGAMWFDAQMYSSERLLISVVLSAARKGAVVANYVQANRFLRTGEAITGVRAMDRLAGQEFDIRARCVVNAAGPWVDSLLNTLNASETGSRFQPSIALNLVTRQVLDGFALGVPSRNFMTFANGDEETRSQVLFIVPWRSYSLLGTLHAPYTGTPEDFQLEERTIDDFLAAINAAYPAADLSPEDVYHVHYGLLPIVGREKSRHSVKLLRESVVVDHAEEDGLSGLISLIGVKYTTARRAAQTVVDLVFNKMGWSAPPCQTQRTPLYGGQMDRFTDFLDQAVTNRPQGLDSQVLERLVYYYGSEYNHVVSYLEDEPGLGETITDNRGIIKPEIVHAVRAEMAQTLADVVLRRTGLGAAAPPDIDALYACAQVMARELGWDQAKRDQEVKELLAAYPLGLSGQVKAQVAV